MSPDALLCDCGQIRSRADAETCAECAAAESLHCEACGAEVAPETCAPAALAEGGIGMCCPRCVARAEHPCGYCDGVADPEATRLGEPCCEACAESIEADWRAESRAEDRAFARTWGDDAIGGWR